MAAISGVVGVNERGCLVLPLGDGPDVTPLVWPHGSSAILQGSDLAGVMLPTGDEVRIGDQFAGSGGFSPMSVKALVSGDPAQCGFDDDDESAFINAAVGG